MGRGKAAATRADATAPPASAPAMQVIVLGSGGGPLESNVTAFLVRSLAADWAKGSVVAVDAGVHLGAITRILEQTQPARLGQTDGPSLPHTLTQGPFAGLGVSNPGAEANAAHIHKNLIETYLITHPHLDHIAGFVINTAGLPGARPKKVAGLPNTIAALKTHVFNNIIWPNLSDENNGAGLVTYMRLVEGGSPALGEGEGRGYVEICEGLAVKAWSVSHGHCIEKHSHRGSGSTRHGSFDASSSSAGLVAGMGVGMGMGMGASPSRGGLLPHHTSAPPSVGGVYHHQHFQERLQGVVGPAGSPRRSSLSLGPPADESSSSGVCVYDSSAFFVRDVATGREVLMFGDVEPDSVSLSPRNRQVWQEAAPRVAAGKLAAVFIECSYDNSQCVERLFGHLTPQFVGEEMTALAEEVVAARREMEKSSPPGGGTSSSGGGDRKRKLAGEEGPSRTKRKTTPQPGAAADMPVSPKSVNHPQPQPETSTAAAAANLATDPSKTTTTASIITTTTVAGGGPSSADLPTIIQATTPSLPQQTTTTTATSAAAAASPSPLRNALRGLKVVIIHVKETMADAPRPGDVIREQLLEHERAAGLGVEYIVSEAGQSLLL